MLNLIGGNYGRLRLLEGSHNANSCARAFLELEKLLLVGELDSLRGLAGPHRDYGLGIDLSSLSTRLLGLALEGSGGRS